jgi:hypothetical protein
MSTVCWGTSKMTMLVSAATKTIPTVVSIPFGITERSLSQDTNDANARRRLIFEAKDIANTAPMVTCGELHQQPPTNTLNHLPAQLL